MRLTPTRDNVVVRKIIKSGSTAGTIIVTEKPDRAEVVAIGPQVEAVKVGDILPLGKEGSAVRVDGSDYRVLKEKDIHAVFVE
jgi:co-chaperonin GroES (HSP10)